MWSIVLGSIGGISLLTGGVGIMNIMLASVNERAREIGIRRALGARRRDILVQFLIETVILSVCGGAVGIAMAMGVAMLPEQKALISTPPILMAFSFSLMVGLFFGLYPVEALRYE
jgi:putative ABC transport system permease protein